MPMKEDSLSVASVFMSVLPSFNSHCVFPVFIPSLFIPHFAFLTVQTEGWGRLSKRNLLGLGSYKHWWLLWIFSHVLLTDVFQFSVQIYASRVGKVFLEAKWERIFVVFFSYFGVVIVDHMMRWPRLTAFQDPQDQVLMAYKVHVSSQVEISETWFHVRGSQAPWSLWFRIVKGVDFSSDVETAHFPQIRGMIYDFSFCWLSAKTNKNLYLLPSLTSLCLSLLCKRHDEWLLVLASHDLLLPEALLIKKNILIEFSLKYG